MILRGSLSFWAAWVQASSESFWQSISLHSCSLSDSASQGCDCRFRKKKKKADGLVRLKFLVYLLLVVVVVYSFQSLE